MPTQYLILISVIGWGVGSVFYKLANQTLHPIMVSTIGTVLYIILIPLGFLFMKVNTQVNASGIMWATLAALCTCAGSLGYFYALRNGGGAGVTTALTSLYPALTLIISAAFLKEALSLKQGVGILLALISFYLLSIK